MLKNTMMSRYRFAGRTDKYMPPIKTDTALEAAKAGRSFFDVTGALGEEYTELETQRLSRYSQNWDYYKGKHYNFMTASDGTDKYVFNAVARVVNITADWIVGRGFRYIASEGNELVSEALTQIIRYSSGDRMLWCASQFGGICGDAYFYVTVRTTDKAGKKLPPEKYQVVVETLDPAWVHPVFDPQNPGVMRKCTIQFPVNTADKGVVLFSMEITPESFTIYHDTEQVSKDDNMFGCVNVVHVPHEVSGSSVFGISEIDNCMPLNMTLNKVGDTINRIIDYHAEPTTIVYGATVSQLEKGSTRVWSGLPVDGKVENLQLQSDLTATFKWYEEIRSSLAATAEVPGFLLKDATPAVSNTSGLAMQMLYLPLINKTSRRHREYGKGLTEVARLIRLAHETILGLPLEALADSPAKLSDIYPQFSSPLPKDEQTELDLAQKRIQAGIWSEAEAIRQTSGVRDISRLALELAADKRAKLANTLEVARATQGQMPVLSSVFLSSLYLSEDMEGAAAASEEGDEKETDSSEDSTEDSAD